ncbi:hypothetical protein [Devosia sp.]|uniref:hypothetical protein n=1 Tax=Devosia sp. TaxID=1871048 RepID=UPI002EEE3490
MRLPAGGSIVAGITNGGYFDELLVAVVAIGALALPGMAVAAGNSTPGGDRYNNNPGRIQAEAVGAQCDTGAGSGTFGYLGQDLNMGINSDPGDPGANGTQTGLNNSAVCGNR